MAWPPMVDDDSSGTTGTVADKAFFDQIKAYVDTGPPAITLANTWTTDGGPALTGAPLVNRYKKIATDLIFWEVVFSPMTVPVATSQIHASGLPFSFLSAASAYPIHRGSFGPGSAVYKGPNYIALIRNDAANWPAGDLYLWMAATIAVSF